MAATLLTPTQLREHVETDLSDAALQRILDSEEGEIVARYGPHTTATELFEGVRRLITLTRPAAAITQVIEEVSSVFYDDAQAAPVITTLAPSDYRLWFGGRALERLATGPNPRTIWGDRVTVTYVPRDQVAQRTLVLIQLAKLAIAYSGRKQQSVGQGDYAETSADYVGERERLLRTLAPRAVIFA